MINLSKKAKTSIRNCWETFPWAVNMQHQDYYLKPLISVVLPVYNQANLVKHSLNSIFLKNNYPLEVIIIDDGSTDDLEKVIKPYLKDQTRNIKYIYQQNQKLSRALNAGFALAQGVFLSWTSADNIYLPGALDKMADFLLANPSISMVYANVELIDDSGRKIKNSNYRKDNQAKNDPSTLLLPHNASTLCDYNDNFINACFLYRRETRLQVGNFDPEKNGFEDYDYWCRINTQGLIAHLDSIKPLYQYRLHQNSLTHQLRNTNLPQLQSESVFAAYKKIKLLKSRFALKLEAKERTPFVTAIIKLLENENTEVLFNYGNSETIVVTSPDQNISNKLLIFENQQLRCEQKDFLHHNHYSYLTGIKNPFFAISIPLNLRSGKQFLPHSLLLPPLQIPNIFRRARDGSLQAVNPEPRTKLSALIFAPENDPNQESIDWLLEESVALIKNIPQVTWAFLCQNPNQKEFCSKIKKKTNQLKLNNYRILDISEEPQIENLTAQHFTVTSNQQKSLLYILSSIDLIVSLKSAANLNNILELRQEIALGSAAGVSVHGILKNNIISKEFDLKNDLRKILANHALEESLDHTFLKNPYLSFDSLMASHFSLSNKSNTNFYTNFYKKLLKSIKLISINSLEQWLVNNEEKEIAKRIKALLCASSV